MVITEVRVKLDVTPDERILGYAVVTFDGMFVVRDLKIIRKDNGRHFVSMPSRQATSRCENCGHKIPNSNRFCGHCAHKVVVFDRNLSEPTHHDIAHPLSAECRQMIERAVLGEYLVELKMSQERRRIDDQGQFGMVG